MTESEIEQARAIQRERDRKSQGTRQNNSLVKKIDKNFERTAAGTKPTAFKQDAVQGNENVVKIIGLQCRVHEVSKKNGLSGITKIKRDVKKWQNWVTDTLKHDKLIASMEAVGGPLKDDSSDDERLKRAKTAASTSKTTKGDASTRNTPKIKKEEPEHDQEDDEENGGVKVKHEVNSDDEGVSLSSMKKLGSGIDQYEEGTLEFAGHGGSEVVGGRPSHASRIDQDTQPDQAESWTP